MRISSQHSASALLPLGCLACATLGGVLQEPVPRGRVQRYEVSAESLAAAAIRAFSAEDLKIVRDTTIGSTHLLVGRIGVSLMSWGEIDRAAITPGSDLTEVRMISRPAWRLDLLHRDRSPRLFQALDSELGGTGLRPFPGDRVRVVASGAQERTLTGILSTPGDSGGLVIDVGGRPEVLSRPHLARISVSRGRYGHAREGALAGYLLGGILGLVLAPDDPGSAWAGVGRAWGWMIGSLAGAVAGGLTGAAIRTEVWSDLSPSSLVLPQEEVGAARLGGKTVKQKAPGTVPRSLHR